MKQKLSLMMTALLLSIGMSLWGQECTMISIDLSTQGFTNGQELDNTPITVNHDVTLTFHKGTSSNSPKYYNTGTAVRCYGGNYFTVETSSGYISADTLKFGTGDGSNAITTDVGTYEEPTWTGNAATVNFTIEGSSGHRRIKEMVIMYCTGGTPQETVATPTFNPAGGTYTETQNVSIACATEGATIRYTTDETDPTESSSVYNSPLSISETTTVKAKAWKEGCIASAIASATYTIESNPLVFNKVENHAVEAGNTYLIVDVYSGKALTSANGTSSAPTAVPVTISNNQIVTGNSQLQWTFEATEGGYIIHPATDETKWLYSTNTNNGVRIGTNSDNVWVLNITVSEQPNYHGFKHQATSRYLGVYNNQDWRAYGSINNNIKDTQIELFVLGDAPQPTPTLTITPNSLSDLDYVYGNGPSEPQTFTVSGTSLTGNVAINAPENFGICFTASGTYTSSLLLVPNAGTLSATTLYVHLNAGLNAGDYSGNVTAINGEVNATVALSGTVTSMPVVETPTLSPASGTYLEAQTVTIACATEGATIRYTTDGTAPTENSTVYTEALTISTTTTVKAKAWKEGCEASGIAEATYTFPVLITIAEARALEANEYALVQGIVTFIDGRNIYIQDATAGIDLFLNNNTVPSDLALGDLVKVYGKRGVYQGLVELTDINGNDNSVFSILSTGNNLPMTVKTIAEILADHTSGGDQLQATRVKIEGATLGTVNTSGNTPLTQGENSINIYKIPALTGIGEDDIVDVTAVVGCHSNNAQLLVATVEDVVLISHPQSELTVTPTTLTGFSYMFGSGPSETQNFTVSGIHLYENVSVTAPEGFEVSLTAEGIFAGSLAITPTESTLAETTIYIRMATGLSVGDHSGDLTVVCGSASSTVALSGTVNALPVVATPTFSPDGGTYTEAQSVTIACATEGATIRYTTDGTNPTESSTVYTETLTISETTTVKAIAMKDGYQASDIAEATYIINIPEPVLTVAPTALEGFTYTFGSGPSETQTLTVSGSNLTANVVVTAPDGFEVCLSAEGIYDGSITLTPNEGTLAATDVHVRMMAGLAVGDHSGNLTVACGELSETVALNGTVSPMPVAATPTFSPEGGTYTEAQTVTISCTTEGATIHYTLDGTDPTVNSLVYSSPLAIAETTTVKAKAWMEGYQASAVAEATYTINIPVPVSIAEARAQGTGSVFTSGTVTSCVGTTAYIQDATAAICVYGTALTVGDNITVQGTLTTFHGLLEITSPVVTVVSSGNTVEPELMTVAQVNASANQGWYIRVEDATVTAISGSGNSQNTTVAQGDDTVVVRGNLGVTVAVNDILSLNGNIGCFDATQIANPQNVEVQAVEDPVINASDVTIAYDATSGVIPYTVTNPVTGNSLTATLQEGIDWISDINVGAESVAFAATANDGTEDRTATFTLSYTGATDVTVTVTQGHYVPDYATLPFAFNGGKADIENTAGLTQDGLGTDYNATTNPTTKLKFDGTGDWLVLKFNEQPGILSFDIKGNSFSGGTFTVQASEDGVTYTDLENYTELGATQSKEFANLGENVRYIKWIYTEKVNGNVGLGNIALAAYEAPVPAIAVTPTSLSGFAYVEGSGPSATQTLSVSGNNLTANVVVTAPEGFEVCLNTEGTFAGNLTLTPEEGTLTATVYVRMAAGLAVGNHSGNLTVASGELGETVALSGTVTAMPVVATPAFSPEGGTFTEAQTVTISCTTEGATIHYTLDGTDPTVDSQVYSAPLSIAETTTVKAFAVKDGYQASDIASASYNIVEPQQEKAFSLITSSTALVAGEKYIVVGMANDTYKALGKQNNNNRAAVEVTPVGSTIVTTPATLPDEEAIFELTLGQDSLGYWTLYDAANQGYLYAASSSSNYLRTQSSNDANGQWTIAIADNGVATIIAQGNNTRNTLRYNSGNGGLFSCYAENNNQKDVYLYKAGDAPQPEPELAVSPASLSGFTYTYNAGPSATQSINVSGNNLTANVVVTAPEGFEVCLNTEGTFAGNLTLTPEEGTLTATVYVRMAAGLAVGNHSGNLTVASGELGETVALSGTVTAMPVAATPTFSPDGGTFTEAQTVTISCSTEGATIHYTLDGTDPTVNSEVYSSPLSIAETTTVKAFAVKDGYQASTIATAVYTIDIPVPVAATPTFSPDGGTYTEAQSVTISCETEGATIHYTLDGTNPTVGSEVYFSALNIAETTTVKAFAVKDGYQASNIASASYNIVEPQQEKAFSLITSGTALVAGEKYIVVGMANDTYKALGKQNNNNRAAVEVAPVGSTIVTTPAALPDEDAIFELTLGQDSLGYWTLYDAANQGYLYAASSSSNYLRTQSSNDANGQWTIAIANNGVATIIAQGNNTRNTLRYNSGNGGLFSCYAENNNQKDVYLYKAGDAPQPEPELVVSPASLSGFTYTYNAGPSAAQNINVSGSNLTANVVVTAPEGFEVCLNAEGTFAGNLTLMPEEGTLATTVYVRMAAGLAVGDHSGNLTATCGDLNATVALSGTVTAMPVVATPTFSPDGGTYNEAQTVTISCTTEGATIHYTLDGTDPTVGSEVYSAPLSIAETTTVKAFAVKDGYQASAIATAAYTIEIAPSVITIAEARALALDEYALVQGIVTFIDGKNVYIQDETAGIDLFLTANAPSTLALGDTVQAYGKRAVYKGLVELTNINPNEAEQFSIVSTGNELPMAIKTIAEILADFNGNNMLQSTRVKIESATIGAINPNNNTLLTQNGSSINIYKVPALTSIVEGDIVDVTAVIGCFNDPQLRVALASDVVLISQPDPVLTVSATELSGFSYSFGDGPSEAQSFAVSGNNLTANVTVTAPEGFEVCLSADGTFVGNLTLIPEEGTLAATTVYVRMAEGLEVGDHFGDLAVASGDLNETIALSGTVSALPIVAAPTFSPDGGTYTEAQTVTISCETEGATIHYTLDGSDPTVNSEVYVSALNIAETATVKAFAVKDGYEASAIISATYIIEESLTFNKVSNHAVTEGSVYLIVDLNSGTALTSANGTSSAPTAVPVTISNNQIVTGNSQLQWTFEATESGYIIHPANDETKWLYSTNANNGVRIGTNPDNVWVLNITDTDHPDYHGFQHFATSRYLGVYNNQDWRTYTTIHDNIKETQIELFILGDAPQPEPELTVSPTTLSSFSYIYGAGPSETQSITVSGSDLTANVTLTTPESFEIGLSAEGNFTDNISLTPEEGALTATVYVRMAAGLAVGDYSGNLTATCSDLNATVALSGTVTAMPIVAAPTFSPDGGTFTEAQAVTISCETEDATIHYTLDGTDPTVSSEVYVSALTIAETTTVKAFAVKDGYQASDIASASYNIVEPQQEKAFTLITSGTALVAGEKYIVVGMANDTYKALGKQNNNNRSAVEVTPVGNTIVTMPAAMPDEEAIFELTLGQDSVGYWTLYDAANQGYLYAASSSSNHLRTQSSNNANGQWTIAIADNGVATIIAQGANTHNTLRYNSSSNNGLFSCYLSGQQDVYLYKAGDAPQPTPQLAVTPTSLSNFDYAYGEGPSSTQTCTVSGNLLTENVTIAAPEHFEISLSAGGTFGNSLVLEPTSGTLEATAVYVRLAAGLSSGSYSGDLTFTSGELNANVALSGSVGTMPVAATPTFSIEGGTYLAPQTVSISTTTPNATIYYTTDGTDPTVSSLVYSSPIEVATTMTIKAMAVAENYINSAIAEATYTITEPLPISGIHNLPNNTYACMEGTVIMIDGRNVYVQDGTAGIDLYLNNNTVPAELALGDLVRAYGKKTVYNGLIELTGINGSNPSEFAILSSGNPLPLEIHTIAEINDDYAGQNLLQSTRVRIENAIIGTINYSGLTVITQGRAQMNIYHLPYVEGLSEGDLVNINGVIGCYNAPQLLVASAADVEFVQGGHLIATPTTLSGLEYSYESGGPSEIVYFELSGTNLLGDAYIYPSEHFEVSTFEQGMFIPEDPAIVTSTTNNFYDIKIYVRMKAGLPVGTYTDQLAITSEGTQSIYVTVIGTVTGDGPTPPPVTGDYVRISSLSQLTNGSHVILAARYDEVANDYVALFNTLSSGKLNTTEFSSTMSGADEIIPASIVSSESDYYWLVDITANGYTFTNANGDVIGYNSSTNFNMNGTKTEWTVATGVSDEGSMVPNYFGFNIINVATDNRAFALNANHVVGAYHIQNMNGADYNFFLDLFVKGEGGTPVVATPTFTPEGGTYFEAQSVSIACATEGATIHYTLDGTDPTESSPVYTVPLTISETTMVKAFAVKEGYDPSAIATATYVIQTGMVTIFNQDWEGEMNGWTFVDVEGEASWTINQHNGNHYAYANGYNHGTNIDWCISPAFNVDDIDNPVLTFRTAKNYTGPDLEVFFSNDYNGTNPLSATWTSLTCALSQGSWNWVESGDIDLSGFSGTNCYIGFRYTCNDSEAAGWEVDDIMLIGQTTTPIITATPLTLSGFSYVVGNGPSTEQSFTVSGMNLTGNLSIHEATNFEISSTSGSGFNAQPTITLTPTNGTVAETTIYVRMKAGLSAGSYDGDIEIVLTGATTVEVTCNGSVIEEPMPGGDYIRIADVSALQDGNKVILAARYNEVTDAYRAMANTLTSGKLATTEFTSLMNGAYEIIPADIVNDEDSYYWTVGVTANGYTFTNANGDVISYGSSGTNFNMNGEKTEWTVSLATAGDGALVPNYTGFNIINVTTDTRAFAVRYYNEDYICGAYATSNMNNGEYNFFLDIFMQGEGGTPTVAAPTFNPAGGTYYATQDVTISCATPDATIYYSLDSDIGPWYEYNDPVTVDESLTLWAYATKDGYNDSPVVSANYIIQGDIVIIFNQDWEEDWHGWTQVSLEGEAEWDIAEHNGNHYAYINGYNLGSNEDWLFSPAFDLDSHSDVVLTFKTAKNYTGPELEVYFSNDYDGQDPTMATWFELPCELSTGGWNWIESGDISLDGFNGSNCYIGFRYTCTEDEAAAWEVDDIMLVAGGGSSASLTATPNAISGLNYIVGNGPSASQSYDLTAANLEGTGSVMVTVTDGFEISLDDEDFGEELEIDYANGQLVGQPVTVYVRLAEGLEIGGYDGTITHIGGGASTTVSLTGTVLSENEPMIEAFMPYYIQGNNGSNNNRVPVAMQVWIYNLEPNTTYRYTNQFVDANDGPETAGAGNVIYVSETGFYRSTSPSLATEGGYGEFTTDIDGNSELLWFMNEPTANARFTPGNQVYLRIRLNDGHDGTTVDRIFTTEDYATVLNFGTEHNANQGSAFYVKSNELPGSFAALYANYEDERPIYSTSVETVGVDYGSINQYANFYKELVAGNDGWFGGILPNDNETGINLIEVWELGSLFPTEYTSENGQWYPEANTVNPTNGLSEPIFIDLTYDDIDEPVETHIKVWAAYQEFIVENDDADHYSLTVYNVIGQPLLRQQINAGATQRVGHSLPSGLYILNFRNNKNNVSIKLIVR